MRKELRNISIQRMEEWRTLFLCPFFFCNGHRKCHLKKTEDKHLKPVTADTFKTSHNETLRQHEDQEFGDIQNQN